jgi:hypothetical protein
MDESERLRQTLSELHAELRAAKTVDPATRKMLQESLEEIQQALAEADAAPGDTAVATPHGVADRLREATAKFEATHPTLAGLLERLIDLMAAAGI